MSIKLRFSNWFRDYMDTVHYNSEMEEQLMAKAKKRTPTDEEYKTEESIGKERLDVEMAKVDKEIKERLDKLDHHTKLSNHDLIFQLIPATILFEIYTRLEEGRKAIEENKRIKASLDTVNEAIKKMFKLV